MAIFKPVSRAYIEENFTHYARLYGCVPIYFHIGTNACEVRNGWPDWLMDVADAVFSLVELTVQMMDPEHEPMFPIFICGRIRKGGTDENNCGHHAK